MNRTRAIALVVTSGIVALAGGALFLANPPVGSTHFSPTEDELTSRDATVQAQAVLEQFFNALGSGDSERANSFIAPDQRVSDWSVDRLEVGPITPLGSEGRSWLEPVLGPGPERTFVAPIRMWPGDGGVTPGELLSWSWTLQRDSDGTWLLIGWGEG